MSLYIAQETRLWRVPTRGNLVHAIRSPLNRHRRHPRRRPQLIALIGFFVFRVWYQVPQADEAIVIVGKKQKGENGLTSNMTVITGGGAFVNKLTQCSDRISLRSRQIKMEPVA